MKTNQQAFDLLLSHLSNTKPVPTYIVRLDTSFLVINTNRSQKAAKLPGRLKQRSAG